MYDDNIYDNIKKFLEMYENTLKNIYTTGLKDVGKGILYVDINSNDNGNCNTKYISVDSIDNHEDLKIRIKNSNKIFYCMIDNDIRILIEREL